MTSDRTVTRGTPLALLTLMCAAALPLLGPTPTAAAATCDGNHSTLAVGSPGATEGDDQDAGAVTVGSGSSDGLRGRLLVTPTTSGVPTEPEVEGKFGTQVAVGDFNGDSCPDVAIVGAEQPGHEDQVVVLFGAPDSTLTSVGAETFGEESVCGACGDPDSSPELGAHLAVGDFNGDGYDDLALSVVSENADNGGTSVVVVPGSATGLVPSTSDPVFNNLGGLAGDITSMSAGDINGDGIDDLAIGWSGQWVDPDDEVMPKPGAAAVGRPAQPAAKADYYHESNIAVVYGAADGVGAGAARQDFNRATAGVPGQESYASNLHRGIAVTTALGDTNHDGYADLAFWEDRTSAVTVLRGSATGITTKHAQNWTKATPGVPGKQKSKDVDDQWGSALAFGAFSGGDDADLAVGDPTTQNATILPGSSRHGLTAKGSEQLSPSTPNVPGKAGAHEDWSSVLAVGDFGHGSADDLVVADPNAKQHRGSLTVLYGSHHQPAGLTAKHAQHITRSSDGWPGVAETLDYFGSSLAAG